MQFSNANKSDTIFRFTDDYNDKKFKNHPENDLALKFLILKDYNGNKIIRLGNPAKDTWCECADDNAKEYEYLHKKSLGQVDEEEDLKDILLVTSSEGAKYLVLEYNDSQKQKTAFPLSKRIDVERLYAKDLDYIQNCQFYFWIDKYGSHIRFGKPYIEITHSESLINKGDLTENI